MKPYQQISILECGEQLLPIPLEFAIASPHPYIKLGATYGERSPYYLRKGVLDRLNVAQTHLQQVYPGWRIQIFDAYRPVEVQQFMVDYTFNELVQAQKLTLSNISEAQKQAVWQQVEQFWALPSLDPATPPPHSTGAAVDVTLVDGDGSIIDMGGEIDEISERSHPTYYTNATSPTEQQYHTHRQLLQKIMFAAGFQRHPNEWWHFSLGDQMWAWLSNLENPTDLVVARYGRVI